MRMHVDVECVHLPAEWSTRSRQREIKNLNFFSSLHSPNLINIHLNYIDYC